MRRGGAAQANARKRRAEAAEKQKHLAAIGLRKKKLAKEADGVDLHSPRSPNAASRAKQKADGRATKNAEKETTG